MRINRKCLQAFKLLGIYVCEPSLRMRLFTLGKLTSTRIEYGMYNRKKGGKKNKTQKQTILPFDFWFRE